MTGGETNGGSRVLNIPYEAGVRASRPPIAPITLSWDIICRRASAPPVRVEVADEVQHLHAHPRHRHAGGRRFCKLGEPGCEGQVTRPAQLDGVEAVSFGVLPLLDHGLTVEVLLLNRESDLVPHRSPLRRAAFSI
jgi:hypothetical protein